ncbi:hypothetical protein KAX97_02375 [candidate division WOR-3 bacterium]|nr:hypothetical protein [candidate division WOR-3 bacterium]
MRNKGISGFGVIFMIILLLTIGYIAYQIGQVHFTYGTINEKVDHAIAIGYTMTNSEIMDHLIKEARKANVELNPDSIFIDRTILDSLRIYVAYDDSSKIFGFLTYNRHLVIDKIQQIKIRF